MPATDKPLRSTCGSRWSGGGAGGRRRGRYPGAGKAVEVDLRQPLERRGGGRPSARPGERLRAEQPSRGGTGLRSNRWLWRAHPVAGRRPRGRTGKNRDGQRGGQDRERGAGRNPAWAARRTEPEHAGEQLEDGDLELPADGAEVAQELGHGVLAIRYPQLPRICTASSAGKPSDSADNRQGVQSYDRARAGRHRSIEGRPG